MNDASRLGPEERRAALARLAAETFDVVVIGGGVVGCGCALDAATRGLSVALVEKRDFAAGTSSRSSKLIHGGLRYLEQGEIGLVREALRERSLLLNVLAPHLVQPVPFLVPLTEHWQRAYIGAGMVLYDSLGGHEGLPRHRHLTRRGALRVAPALRREALWARSPTTTRKSTTPVTRSPWPARRRGSARRWCRTRRPSPSCARASG